MISWEQAEDRQWSGIGGNMAWDVGANIGQSVEHMYQLGFSKILSFEPALESFSLLQVAWEGIPGVRLFNMAVSDHVGTVLLQACEYPMQSGQLVTPGLPWNWGATLEHREVTCVTLNYLAAVHGTPDLVKIDTEGHEYCVLAGAHSVLEERKTTWLVECHSPDMQQRCLDLLAGYDVEVIEHHEHPGMMSWLKAIPR